MSAANNVIAENIKDKLSKYKDSIVIFVNLPSLKDPVCGVMSETLSNMGITEQEVNKLKESKKQIILILDGYDEINKCKNIYQLSNLS